jgi:hypothetical protein
MENYTIKKYSYYTVYKFPNATKNLVFCHGLFAKADLL